MKKIILVFTLFFFHIAFSQQAEIFKLKKFRVSVLNDSIQETSGLNFLKGKLYTFNDSGNPAELYEIDKNSGKILKSLKTNTENKDWEALTNDGENFYVGDFGNNAGTRKDLKIYKIPFQNNQLQNDLTKTISFYYPEQNDFTSKNISTDYDLESMIYLNGKIHIFTKEWSSKSTTHYTIDPENFENQAAQKVESYKTGFVVTDTYYYEKKLYVVGYTKKTEVFLDIFSESESGIFFKENPKHFYLGSALTIGQIEGIAVDEKGIYISGEKFYSPIKKTKPFFYFIPKEKLKL
ncbi:hypothetical protein CHRY9390_00205 [Chryseobacterium aquaeductus]|uniref:T9SS C-terminal target domain-containing protein n=1 Tax=Chryseobacterium aquaeductus TaxID=2675056 RepID=A0A9N8MD44_9FLAO|nr:hypothetical protein [Chryseobacterium aquaeductus]CAA7329566.1 hypothetical protein CHRY9390_00205 [Chryseobacterium potabilaquae]CAD7797655.1 hypothetical protein CHRY9390_00205 [Chryseobacterium aquaeductus]